MLDFFKNFVLVVSGVLGLYGSLISFVPDNSAIYFLLTLVALVGFYDNRSKVPISWRQWYDAVGLLLVGIVAFLGWDNGAFHSLAERISCDMKLRACGDFRIARIRHEFRPINFEGYNERLNADMREEVERFCNMYLRPRAKSAAIGFVFDHDTSAKLSYRLKPLGEQWRVVAHVPDATSGTVDIGHPEQQGNLLKASMVMKDGSSRVLVRVCMSDDRPSGLDPVQINPSHILDIEDIKIQ